MLLILCWAILTAADAAVAQVSDIHLRSFAKLLLNANRIISHGTGSLAVIGVENTSASSSTAGSTPKADRASM